MLMKEFFEICNMGVKPAIKFKENVGDHIEESVDPNMMGIVVSCAEEGSDCYRLHVDLNPFENHNRDVAVPNWFDKNGKPSLTWFEVGRYPENGIETIYLAMEGEAPFEIVDDKNSPISEFIKAEYKGSYTAWLEEKLKEERELNYINNLNLHEIIEAGVNISNNPKEIEYLMLIAEKFNIALD